MPKKSCCAAGSQKASLHPLSGGCTDEGTLSRPRPFASAPFARFARLGCCIPTGCSADIRLRWSMDFRYRTPSSTPCIIAPTEGIDASPLSSDIVSNSPLKIPCRIRGVRVTSLRKTLVDCLCASDFRVGLAIADSAIHWELASKREIANWIEEDGRGRRGVRQARQTIAWADGRSENGGESIARATMIELGFVAPLLQVEVFDPMEPDSPKRGDFGWWLEDGSWVIGELDGIGKYRKDDVNGTRNGLDAAIRALAAERRRESHLCLSGSKVVRFGMRDVLDTAYFERLLTAAGVPRREEPSD